MSDTSIKLNPANCSQFEFDVKIEGMNENDKHQVRFVVTSKSEQCDYSITCTKIKGTSSKWNASIPALVNIKETSAPFRIEAIIDGYYFEAITGTVQFVQAPVVTISVNDLTEPQKPPVIEVLDIKHVESNPLMTSKTDLTPNRDLLIQQILDTLDPNPTLDTDSESTLDQTSHNQIEDNITDAQFDEVINDADDLLATQYDSKQVAEGIMQRTLGVHDELIVKGTTFKRDTNGRLIIAGLETPEQIAMKVANAVKVRNILNY